MEDVNEEPAYFVSWSGGKDGCLAMHRMARSRGAPACLLTMLDEKAERSRGHHLRPEVLQAQAAALGSPVEFRATSWEGYEDRFKGALVSLKGDGVAEGVFGDIDLAEHREWVERVCAESGVVAHEPLWLERRRLLLKEFVDSGYQAVVVGVKRDVLDCSILGRLLTTDLIREFEAAGIDASGELGEYHTMVLDGPLFHRRVEVTALERISYDGYEFLDLVPT